MIVCRRNDPRFQKNEGQGCWDGGNVQLAHNSAARLVLFNGCMISGELSNHFVP